MGTKGHDKEGLNRGDALSITATSAGPQSPG